MLIATATVAHRPAAPGPGKHPSRGSIFRSSYPAIERVATHPRFDEISFILNDFLEVEGHAFDAESMERILISRVGSRYTNPRIRVMLVTTNESLFALADVTKPGASPATNETKGFSSVDEAKAWFSRQAPLVQTAYRAV